MDVYIISRKQLWIFNNDQTNKKLPPAKANGSFKKINTLTNLYANAEIAFVGEDRYYLNQFFSTLKVTAIFCFLSSSSDWITRYSFPS